MGGHTAYSSEDASPGRSALVAVVGPLSNALMAVAGWLALGHVPGDGALELLLLAFTWSNAFVAAFNALPGLPLDGGFLVDALVWKLTGSRAKGMMAAGWCGRLVAVGIVAWAFLPLVRGHGGFAVWDLAWRLFIASFLWRGASVAVTVGTNREFLSGISVENVMRPAVSAPESTMVADLPESADPVVLLDADGAPSSLVAPGSHVRVPVDQRHVVPASALAQVLAPGAVAEIGDLHGDVTAILPAFEAEPTPGAVVLTDGTGGVVGVVLLGDLERALAAHARHRGV